MSTLAAMLVIVASGGIGGLLDHYGKISPAAGWFLGVLTGFVIWGVLA